MPLPLRYGLCGALVAAAALTLLAQDHLPSPQTPSRSPRTAPDLPQGTIDLSSTAPELARGQKLFETHCAYCHGPKGEGAKGPTLAQPKLPRAADDASLVRIIRQGIDGTEMPRARMEREDVLRVAAYVKSLGSLPPERVPGDPRRGAELYMVKGVCNQCHTVNGQGRAFGPDLSDVGRRRSAAYLRRSMLEPEAEVPQSFSAFRQDVSLPENFLYVRAILRNGEEISGVRVNEDTFSIQIRDVGGRLHSFFKSELGALHKEFGKSPMPNYSVVFSKDEVDDVVAFLVSLREKK